MKKRALIFLCMIVLSFGACEKEVIQNEQRLGDDVVNLEQQVDSKLSIKMTCVYFYEYGRWEVGPWGLFCNKRRPGICSIKRFCFPEIYIDPCELIPCWIDFLDPWVIYEKFDPREFRSFRDKLELDIDPRVSSVPFALNEQVMGLQFYEKNELMYIKNEKTGVFNLNEDITFDRETSENLGLKGNVVKAGEYPILINEENNTFNVILSVEKGFEK